MYDMTCHLRSYLQCAKNEGFNKTAGLACLTQPSLLAFAVNQQKFKI